MICSVQQASKTPLHCAKRLGAGRQGLVRAPDQPQQHTWEPPGSKQEAEQALQGQSIQVVVTHGTCCSLEGQTLPPSPVQPCGEVVPLGISHLSCLSFSTTEFLRGEFPPYPGHLGCLEIKVAASQPGWSTRIPLWTGCLQQSDRMADQLSNSSASKTPPVPPKGGPNPRCT